MRGNYEDLFPEDEIVTVEGVHPDLVALITAAGKIPPLSPLPPEEVLRGLNDPAMNHLNHLIAEAARNYRMVRQEADFTAAMGQLMVLQRHWMLRRGDTTGALH